MNWYKSARRNPYEQLANKFANEFFNWFIQQPYADNYNANRIEEEELGFTELPLTKQDFASMGIEGMFRENRPVMLQIYADKGIEKPFNISARAFSNAIFPIEQLHNPAIMVNVRIKQMNQSIWQTFKQQLHEVLRHEFEHLDQYATSFKQNNALLQTKFTPEDQKPNEFWNARASITGIKNKILIIRSNLEEDNPDMDIMYGDVLRRVMKQLAEKITYFSQPAELEAFATDAYYDARKKGISVEQALQEYVGAVLTNPDYPHPQVDWLLDEAKNIIIHWMLRFIENRYPDYSKQRNQQPV